MRWPFQRSFLACGSKVFYILLLPIFTLQVKIGNKKMIATALPKAKTAFGMRSRTSILFERYCD
jgi:hypothetical protein